MPLGSLTELLLVWIKKGHGLVSYSNANLFLTGSGSSFSDTTFIHFWNNHILHGAPFKKFPPSNARRIFIEDYTSSLGVEPTLWDGAATVMGNTTRQVWNTISIWHDLNNVGTHLISPNL